MVLGIRPEDVELSQAGREPGEIVFQAVVDLVEPMGAETNFYLQTGHHTVICRSPVVMDHRETGHRLQFQFKRVKTHVFDPVTTERIT